MNKLQLVLIGWHQFYKCEKCELYVWNRYKFIYIYIPGIKVIVESLYKISGKESIKEVQDTFNDVFESDSKYRYQKYEIKYTELIAGQNILDMFQVDDYQINGFRSSDFQTCFFHWLLLHMHCLFYRTLSH